MVFFGGRPSSRNSGKFHGFGSFQSGVHSVLVAGVTTGRVEAAAWAAGAGICGQALASAGRRRHRQAEGWCGPTSAGVRRRPEPSLRHGCAIRSSSGPGRTPALSPPAGQLAPRVGGQRGTARQDRAQRHVSYLDWNRYLGAPQRGPGVSAGALCPRRRCRGGLGSLRRRLCSDGVRQCG